MKWKIEAINVGSYGPVAETVNYFDGDANASHWLPSLVFALHSVETGETIVCDASFSDAEKCSRIMGASAWAVEVKRDKPLPELLKNHGVNVEEVKTVILSHHHWDHAGGASYFKNARMYIMKADWDFAMADETLHPEFKEELLAIKDQVVFADEDDASIPGIRMVKVGGHTVGSMLVFVDTPDGEACLGFDNIMCSGNIEQRRHIGLAYNEQEAKAALELVLSKGCTCYFGHEMP